jgi:hypothetical protein
MRKDRKHNYCCGHCFWSLFFFRVNAMKFSDIVKNSSRELPVFGFCVPDICRSVS